jgi:hypothetical protein
MAEKTAAEKMRMKPGMSVALLHSPEGMAERLGMPPEVTRVEDPADADFVLEFVTTQAEAEDRLRALTPLLGEKTLAWLAYPKGSRAAGYDLNRDTIWSFAQSIGLDFIANVSIDDMWSGMRMRPAR